MRNRLPARYRLSALSLQPLPPAILSPFRDLFFQYAKYIGSMRCHHIGQSGLGRLDEGTVTFALFARTVGGPKVVIACNVDVRSLVVLCQYLILAIMGR